MMSHIFLFGPNHSHDLEKTEHFFEVEQNAWNGFNIPYLECVFKRIWSIPHYSIIRVIHLWLSRSFEAPNKLVSNSCDMITREKMLDQRYGDNDMTQ